MTEDVTSEYKREEVKTVTVVPADAVTTTEVTSYGNAPQKLPLAMYILASIVVLGFFVVLGCLMFVDIPQANIGPANQLFGILSSAFAGVLQYFFGSSIGSNKKSDTINEIAKKV